MSKDHRVHAQSPERVLRTACGLDLTHGDYNVIMGDKLEPGVIATFGVTARVCRDCWRENAHGDWLRVADPPLVHKIQSQGLAGTVGVCGARADSGVAALFQHFYSPLGLGMGPHRKCPTCWEQSVEEIACTVEALRQRCDVDLRVPVERIERKLTRALDVAADYLRRYKNAGGDLALLYEQIVAVIVNQNPAEVQRRPWDPTMPTADKPPGAQTYPYTISHAATNLVQGGITRESAAACGWPTPTSAGHGLVADATLSYPRPKDDEPCPRCWVVDVYSGIWRRRRPG